MDVCIIGSHKGPFESDKLQTSGVDEECTYRNTYCAIIIITIHLFVLMAGVCIVNV